MRKLILIGILLISVICVNATIWRVAQDDSYLPHFKTVQTAIDGANAGDTIYVYPGTYGVNGIKILKPIVFFGSGYYLSENATDSLSRFKESTIFDGYLTFGDGSNLSMIQGIRFINGSVNCENNSFISIENCYLSKQVNLSNCKNIVIKKSILDGYHLWYNGWYNESYVSISSSNCKSVILANNYIYNQISFDSNTEAYIINNFIGKDIGLSNSTIENNILMGNNFSFSNCWSQYNVIKTGSNYNFPLNNSIFATYEQVYTNPITTDHYQLPSNSAAKGKGEGGVDCGPFGGDDPYQISGISTIPSIVDFNVKAQATEVSGLKMRIKIKANK